MDYDSPWKEALEFYFRPFLALFFPRIHDDIDWARGFVFLDKELQKLVPKAARGRLYVDKLVKVWRKDGHETWVLIHIEVQTQRDPDFPKRMYRYNNRIGDRYDRTVVSLAVLADDDPDWRPEHYKEDLWGWSVSMTWPPVKLLDFADRVAELEASDNPFAKVVLAHLKVLETRNDPAGRQASKFQLVRGLHERGFSKQDAWQLIRIIDWVMELPPALQEVFEREVDKYQEEHSVHFYDFMEKRGILHAIEDLLRTKFGDEGAELMPDIKNLRDGDKYIAMNRAVANAATVDEVRKACVKVARRKKNGNGKGGTPKP